MSGGLYGKFGVKEKKGLIEEYRIWEVLDDSTEYVDTILILLDRQREIQYSKRTKDVCDISMKKEISGRMERGVHDVIISNELVYIWKKM